MMGNSAPNSRFASESSRLAIVYESCPLVCLCMLNASTICDRHWEQTLQKKVSGAEQPM